MQKNSNSPSLESLPTEVKLLILCQLDDPSALQNLTSASTSYGEIERGRREEILTAITLNYVIGHGFDPFSVQDVIAVSFGKRKILRYGENSIHEVAAFRDKKIEGFWDAMQEFYKACQQHNSTKSTTPLKIPVAICKPLWQIVHAVGWTVHDDIPLDSNGTPDNSHVLKIWQIVSQAGAPTVRTAYLHGKLEFKCYSSTYGSVFLGAPTSQWTGGFKRITDGTIKSADKVLMGETRGSGVKGLLIYYAVLFSFVTCLMLWEVEDPELLISQS